MKSKRTNWFKRILVFSILFIGYRTAYTQYRSPVLKSDSTSVIIQIDGNRVAVWNIEPDTKPWIEPDVFKIERAFKERKVTYLSNRNSISFNVKPGDKYDFIILISNKGAFPMEVGTFGKPVFEYESIVICIFLVIIMLAFLTYAKRKTLNIITLLWIGIITPLLFWVVTITGGFIHGNYNHLHNVVSELGAIGTTSETFMSTTEILISILSVFSIFGFYKAGKEIGMNVFPVLTILTLSISMFWAAIFPMHHEWHGILGPIPLLLNIGAFTAIFVWKGKEFHTLRLYSILGFILMSFIVLRFIPRFGRNFEGLIQRFFYLGWSVWSIALSLVLISILEGKKGKYDIVSNSKKN